VRRGWRPHIRTILLLLIAFASAIVIAVVHPQRSAHDIKVVQISACGGSSVGIGVLEETKALGSTGLFVVDQPEVNDLADATEDLTNLLFADACYMHLAGKPKVKLERAMTHHMEYCQ